MKRIVMIGMVLVTIAATSAFAQQPASFADAAAAAERELDERVLHVRLMDVLGEGVYTAIATDGSVAYVSAATGRVTKTTSASDANATPWGAARGMGAAGRGGPRSRVGRRIIGDLLEASGAEIDLAMLERAARAEGDRDDLVALSVGLRGGEIVAHTVFGGAGADGGLVLILDAQDGHPIDRAETGAGFRGGVGRTGAQGRFGADARFRRMEPPGRTTAP
ncbi:MAG: hypothetical protein ACOC0E_13330 [Spirochaetota bacterium]